MPFIEYLQEISLHTRGFIRLSLTPLAPLDTVLIIQDSLSLLSEI